MFRPLGIFLIQGSDLCLLHLLLCRQILYCWAIRAFNFMVVVSFKCYWSSFFFFNHEKVLKFLNCSLCINWDHGFSLRFVNVVHCLLACLLCKALQSCSTLCDPHGQQPTRLLCSWESLVKNNGVGWYFILLGIFLIQGSDLCLLHLLLWRQILYC